MKALTIATRVPLPSCSVSPMRAWVSRSSLAAAVSVLTSRTVARRDAEIPGSSRASKLTCSAAEESEANRRRRRQPQVKWPPARSSNDCWQVDDRRAVASVAHRRGEPPSTAAEPPAAEEMGPPTRARAHLDRPHRLVDPGRLRGEATVACARPTRASSSSARRAPASRSIVHTTRVSGSRSAACAQSRSPSTQAERRPLLARLRGRLAFLVSVRGRGRVEGGPQHAQRHPVGIDRQRGVQVQAAGHGPGLVRTDGSQPQRLAAPGEVQAGAVLDGCGREPGCPGPPAQIRTCALTHTAPTLGG